MSDPSGMLSGMPRWDGKTPEERFWAKVDKTGQCWVWTGGKFRHGYGAVKRDGKQLKAHRVAWEMHFGRLPDGALIMHHCDNPSCVRPQHLFPGTDADNSADKIAKGRQAYGERITANRTYQRGSEHWQHRCPELAARGEQHGNARLTEAIVADIRRGYRFGNGALLARRYGVGSSTIYRVVKGVTWV